MHTLMRVVLCWLIAALPVQAQTLFSESFDGYGNEAQTIAALRAKYGCSYSFPAPWTNGAPQDLDSTQQFDGTYSLKMTYTGTQNWSPPQGGGHCEYDYADQTSSEIWVTWYHRFGTGFQTGGGGIVADAVATKGPYNYMKSLSTGQGNGWVFHYFYGGRQLTLSAQGIKDHRGPNGPGTGTVIPYDTENMWQNVRAYEEPDNQWTCYEAQFKLNTPGQFNGQYQLYITPQGQSAFLAASHTGREFVGTTPQDRMPSDARWYRFKYYRQDGYGDMWYDKTSVTKTRLGCSGTPPPGGGGPPPPPPPAPDTSLPNAPTNLTVTELWHEFKQLVATVWSWIGPASAEAATAASDRVVIRWEPRPGQRFTLDLTGFGWTGAKTFADLDAGLGTLTVPLPGLPPGKPGDDRWLCATERDGKAVTGCNQLALGPIVLPPVPVPVPAAPPATVSMLGDTITIQCDKSRFTRMKTTGTGTKRVITCLK